MLRTHAYVAATLLVFAAICTGCHHLPCHSCAPTCASPKCCLPPQAPCCQAPKASCCGGHRCCLIDWWRNHCCCNCCHEGCSEVYWCEWINDPPDCCDPCDQCYGCWTGPQQCCHKIIIDPLLWVLSINHRICLHPWERPSPCVGCNGYCPYGYNDNGCCLFGNSYCECDCDACCQGGCETGCDSGCCDGNGPAYYDGVPGTPHEASPGAVNEVPDPALDAQYAPRPRTASHTEPSGLEHTGRFVR